MAQDLSFPASAAEEVPFAIGELFYSRTDARGVILAGNPVFQRVSGYDWAALIGAPHRIVRHGATPRAVFRILWQTIQKGEPAVAYVCNRAADGRHYWVLATVLPYEAGYLSVRIKPSSPLFAQVQALYAELAAAERGGLSIEASVTQLLARLAAAGFASYADFMQAALDQEYQARRAALGGSGGNQAAEVAALRRGLDEVAQEQDALRDEIERMLVLPTNLRILAARLEPEGGPVSAIAGIYMSVAADIFRQVELFFLGPEALCVQMSGRFERAMFLGLCSALQNEVVAASNEGAVGSGIDQAQEAAHLLALGQSCDAKMQDALHEAEEFAAAIAAASATLRRTMLSLETVTVMGRTECARLGDSGIRLTATIDRLHDLNAQISTLLGKITDLAAMIDAGLGRLRAAGRKQAAMGQ